MRIAVLRPDNYRKMPWKNGLGVTTEIARAPEGVEKFGWRVSIATVASDGPFSNFAGYDRIIVALDGAGMVLSHPASRSSVVLDPLMPYVFNGDVETTCALRGGPIRDFNVMTRRGAFDAALSVVRLEARAPLRGPAPLTLLYCLTGAARIESQDRSLSFSRDETVRIDCDGDEDDALVLTRGSDGATIMRVDLHATA